MEDNFDKEFDRLFARDLNAAGQDARPDAEAWPALRNRLDAANHSWEWPSKLLWLVLLLLLLSNGWLLLQWKTLRKEATMLYKEAVNLNTSNATASQIHETTIIYDTIYRTVVVRSQIEATSSGLAPIDGVTQIYPVNAPSLSVNTPNMPSHPVNALGQVPNHPINAPKKQENAPEKDTVAGTENNATLLPQPTPLVPDSIRQISEAIIKADQSSSVQKTDSTVQKQEKTAIFDSSLTQLSPILPTIKRHREPRHWRIGAGIGTTSLFDAHHIKLSNPVAFSLQGELLINRRWAFAPALTYQAYGYNTERRFDPRLLIDPPVFPGPDYRLKYIEGNARQFSPSLSVQYRFRPEKRWSWYASIGYAILLTKQGDTEYEFTNLSNGDEKQYSALSRPIHFSSSALMQTGIEYAIKPRLLLFGSASGLFDLSDKNRNFSMKTMLFGAKCIIH